MKSNFIKFFVLFISIIGITSATDYCEKELCKGYDDIGNIVYKNHVACDHDGQFNETCPDNPELIPMTEEKKSLFLKIHNRLRDKLARGLIPGFAKAAKMPVLQWDDELAKLAEYNVKSCIFAHDECRNTDTFKFAGQNLGRSLSYPDFLSIPKYIKNITREWFNEYRFASQANTDQYTTGYIDGKQIGHFTAFIQQKTTRIGCAMSKFINREGWNEVLTACNYSYTNFLNEPIYTKGKPCSGCVRKCGKVYKSLCNPKEKVEAVPDLFLKSSINEERR